MMTIKVPVSLAMSNRYFLKDEDLIRLDRKDIYSLKSKEENVLKYSINLIYEIEEANCNPDYDW